MNKIWKECTGFPLHFGANRAFTSVFPVNNHTTQGASEMHVTMKKNVNMW